MIDPNELNAEASAASSTIAEILGIARMPIVAESRTVDYGAYNLDNRDKRHRMITYNQEKIRILPA